MQNSFGVMPIGEETQPLTPRPSALPLAVVSTVRCTAGRGAVSTEKKF